MTAPANPLRRSMDMGQIIEGAIRLYRLNFGEFLAIAAVTLPLSVISAVVAGSIEDKAVSTGVYAVFAVPTAIVGLIAQAAIARSCADIADEQPPDFESAFRRVLPLTARLIVTALRVFIIFTALAITIVGIPFAFYFLIRWIFFSQAIVIEGESSSGATDLSARLVQGRWWRTFGIVMVILLLWSVPAGIVQAALSSTAPVASSLAMGVVAAVVLPFSVGAETLLFFDLQSRERESVSIA